MRGRTPKQGYPVRYTKPWDGEDDRLHAQKQRRENLLKLRRSKLTDEDHRIYAIAQLGGVVRVVDFKRGVVVESFRTRDGEDCTQSITKLQRCELIIAHEIPRVGIIPATRTDP